MHDKSGVNTKNKKDKNTKTKSRESWTQPTWKRINTRVCAFFASLAKEQNPLMKTRDQKRYKIIRDCLFFLILLLRVHSFFYRVGKRSLKVKRRPKRESDTADQKKCALFPVGELAYFCFLVGESCAREQPERQDIRSVSNANAHERGKRHFGSALPVGGGWEEQEDTKSVYFFFSRLKTSVQRVRENSTLCPSSSFFFLSFFRAHANTSRGSTYWEVST